MVAVGLPFVEELSKLPTSAILIYMLAVFLAFGVISNFIDNGSVLYNLGQGVFISAVIGAGLYFARYLSRKRIATRVKLQPLNPKEASV